jgi:hypothetical protein
MAKRNTHQGAQLRQSTAGTIAFMDMSAAGEYKPAKQMKPLMSYRQLSFAPWALWGKDNLMPQKMVADIDCTGILQGIIDGKARFALCEGMVPAIVKRDPATGQRKIESIVEDDEITQFLDTSDHFATSFGWMKDQIGMGSGAARLMLNKDKTKVAAISRDDFSFLRYEKQNIETGNIDNVYLSAAWQRVVSASNDPLVVKLPLLSQRTPLDDLKQKAGAGVVEHVMTFSHPSWGTLYYPKPLWYAAHKWVKIAQGVPEMKAAMFENTMMVKYLVVIYDEYWTTAHPDWDELSEDEKENRRVELFDDIEDFLIGAKNANKTLFVDGKRDTVGGHSWQNVEIKVIDNKTLTGEMLPDAAAANSEIAFSLLFNPAIIGASMPSGPYTNSQGGSSVVNQFYCRSFCMNWNAETSSE